MKIRIAAMAGLMLTAPMGAAAHHSFAMFDKSKTVALKGTVKEFQWVNPHVYLRIKSNAGKDPAARLVFEGGSINMLTRNGWKPAILKAGDVVVVDYHPLRNGDPGGAVQSVKLPNGKVLKTW